MERLTTRREFLPLPAAILLAAGCAVTPSGLTSSNSTRLTFKFTMAGPVNGPGGIYDYLYYVVIRVVDPPFCNSAQYPVLAESDSPYNPNARDLHRERQRFRRATHPLHRLPTWRRGKPLWRFQVQNPSRSSRPQSRPEWQRRHEPGLREFLSVLCCRERRLIPPRAILTPSALRSIQATLTNSRQT